MPTLKYIAFGLLHGFIFLGGILALELFGIFCLAKPVGQGLIAHGTIDWVAAIIATASAILPILIAWKPLLRYTDWLENELRRREIAACKACQRNRALRAAKRAS